MHRIDCLLEWIEDQNCWLLAVFEAYRTSFDIDFLLRIVHPGPTENSITIVFKVTTSLELGCVRKVSSMQQKEDIDTVTFPDSLVV